MLEISEILAQIVQIHDIREFDPGLTPKQIESDMKDMWFQLTQEAHEFYQHCDGLESEGFYVLSLAAATDTYLEWCEDWGRELDLLPVAVTDDPYDYYAIQVTEVRHAESPVYRVLSRVDPKSAEVAYQNLRVMLMYHFPLDM